MSAAITAAVITAGAGIYSASQTGDATSARSGLTYPDYIEDPYFNESQEQLSGLGENILEGDVPDFYKDIGKAGSPAFEKFMNMSNADISKSVLESAAATGRSGGAVQSQTAEAIGKNETQLRYKDYLNSVEGKKWMMNMGVNLTTGVRESAASREARLNKSAVGGAEYAYKQAGYQDEFDIAQGAAEGEAWGDVLGMFTSGMMGASGGGGWQGAAKGVMGGV